MQSNVSKSELEIVLVAFKKRRFFLLQTSKNLSKISFLALKKLISSGKKVRKFNSRYFKTRNNRYY